MATSIGSKDELTRLKRAREAVDRAYNDALTLVDHTLAPRPELPHPPRAFDHRLLTLVNESWRVAPDVERLLGTGWKRRLRAWVWGLVGRSWNGNSTSTRCSSITSTARRRRRPRDSRR